MLFGGGPGIIGIALPSGSRKKLTSTGPSEVVRSTLVRACIVTSMRPER